MLKFKGFDTTSPNFVSKEVNTWGLQGPDEGRPFKALWIDRSDDRSMFLSFTKSFMEPENEGEESLFDMYYSKNEPEINEDFNFVFKNTSEENRGKTPPILNLTDGVQSADIMAFHILTRDNEMITNVNTGLGVNNYSAWISPGKQELIAVSSFDDEDSCLEIFVQNMDTNMVVRYLIGFNACYSTPAFPSGKNFKVPDQIWIPITRHDLSKVSETLVILMEGDELSSLEKKIIGEKSATLMTISDDASPEEIRDGIRDIAKKYRDKKVILVRNTPIATGMVLKTFHNNVFVLHQYDESGLLFKIV